MKIDDIWSIYVTPTASNYNPVNCVSINLFKLNLTGYSMLMVFINDTLPNGFFIYASDPYQFNPNRDNTDNFDMFPSGKEKMMKIRMKQKERKPTKKYHCDGSNQQRYTECIESFIMENLQCKPSWFNIANNKPLCTGSAKYQTFLALLRDLKKADCNIPNCIQNTWKTQEIWTNEIHDQVRLKHGNGTLIQYFAFATTVEVSNEVFVYEIMNIFNDFAGVVSLLLGASFISLFDYIFELSANIYDSFKK